MVSVTVNGLPTPTLPDIISQVTRIRDDCDTTLRVLSMLGG